MKKFESLFLIGILAWSIVSCSDGSSGLSSAQPSGSAFQIPWCQPAASGRVAVWDSCFNYQFIGDNLSIDLCLPDNCSHDSVRFAVGYEIANDTIFINAVDTATSNLRCPCNFIVHASFDGLPLEKYRVRCIHIHPTRSWVVYERDVRRGGS